MMSTPISLRTEATGLTIVIQRLVTGQLLIVVVNFDIIHFENKQSLALWCNEESGYQLRVDGATYLIR